MPEKLIYPNQTYKATLKDKDYEFYIESKEKTTDDGYFNLENAKLTIYDKLNYARVNNKDLDEKYMSFLLNYDIWNR